MIRANAKYYLSGIEYGEDNLWTIPNVIMAKSIYIMSDFYPYNYRCNVNSITHSVHDNIWQNFCKLEQFIVDMLKDLKEDSLIPQVYCDSVFHAGISINNIIDSDACLKNKKALIMEIVNSDFVANGIKDIKWDLLSLKEKIYVFLLKYKMTKSILISKILQNSIIKKKRLTRQDKRINRK